MNKKILNYEKKEIEKHRKIEKQILKKKLKKTYKLN
jgi:hypothetical protein